MNIQLDGACMTTREALHDHLTRQLQLPLCYGRNLDALYDLLTEMTTPVTLNLVNRQALVDALGSYGAQTLRVLQDAAEENPYLTVSIS